MNNFNLFRKTRSKRKKSFPLPNENDPSPDGRVHESLKLVLKRVEGTLAGRNIPIFSTDRWLIAQP
jgi:hypothetical protein